MAKHSRPSDSGSSLIVLIILSITAWTHRTWVIYAIGGLTTVVAVTAIVKLTRWIRLRKHSLALRDIDMMDGLEFERYIANLLKQHGFRNISLTEQYDIGVDIIAVKDSQRWGIQVKRYSGLVKAAAVRQVVTALKFYDCERAMVITNSTYSTIAQQLAESNDCVLIDRSALQKLIA